MVNKPWEFIVLHCPCERLWAFASARLKKTTIQWKNESWNRIQQMMRLKLVSESFIAFYLNESHGADCTGCAFVSWTDIDWRMWDIRKQLRLASSFLIIMLSIYTKMHVNSIQKALIIQVLQIFVVTRVCSFHIQTWKHNWGNESIRGARECSNYTCSDDLPLTS